MKRVSIVLATYNGERYLKEQLDSIIQQMLEPDELIISDDGSTDKTFDIIKSYLKDNRCVFIQGPQKGYAQNFLYGLSKSQGDIILFSDQDDIWMNNKIEYIRNFFERNPNQWLVCHDMYLATNNEINNNNYSQKSFNMRKRKNGYLYNMLFNGYYGCCMGITKEFKDHIFPFPSNVIQHDQWISIIAEFFHRASFVDEPLIVHRLHERNISHAGSIMELIYYKYNLLLSTTKTIMSINPRKLQE